jgi:Ohr subfamily peroxiredoxin
VKPLYTAQARATGGRDGRTTATDGHPDLLLKPPAALGGPTDQPEATNPEELFALGYGACFLNALQRIARMQKQSAKAYTMDTRVVLGQEPDETFTLAVELHGELPGVELEQAKELMRIAHTVCPYSKATRGNIDVALFVGETPVDAG